MTETVAGCVTGVVTSGIATDVAGVVSTGVVVSSGVSSAFNGF